MTAMGSERISNRVMNLGDLVTQAAQRLPDRPAVIVGERRVSWRELNRRTNAAAAGLAALGVGRGDRVILQAKNCAEYFEIVFAVYKLGAVIVPANFRIHPSDMEQIAALTEAAAVLVHPEFAAHADAARATGVARAICLGPPRAGETGYFDLVSRHLGESFRAAPVDRDDPCWLFLTSGTTGKPKAAILSHGQMAFVVNNHLADLMPGLGEEDASLVLAPLSHGAGLNQLVVAARGVASVLTESPTLDPDEAFRLIARHRIANVFTVPTILAALASHPAAGRYDHSSLRYVIYAGAPMLRAHQRQALSTLGPCLVQYFGLGEVTGNITVLPPGAHSIDDAAMKVGSCGYARTGMAVEIQSEDGVALPAGETGEICVSGPAVFNGYFRNPQANAESFRNGWFRTGDLGHMDAEGFVYITGRRSDMFISGGSNIYPLEIEEKVATHPAVREACVLGMPDDKWGEICVAVVALRPGAALSLDDLAAHLRQNLASYKLPRRLVILDELPKSAYGKVPKRLVRQKLLEMPGA
jgi:fatty-acyl-CoA synthase